MAYRADLAAQLVLAPAAAALLAGVALVSTDDGHQVAVLAGLVFLTTAWFTRRGVALTLGTPFAGTAAFAAVAPAMGAAGLVALHLIAGTERLPVDLLVLLFVAVWLLGLFASLAVDQWIAPRRPVRIAVAGSASATECLAHELDLSHQRRYQVVGRIGESPVPDDAGPAPVSWLGDIGEVGRVAAAHRIDLILMSDDVPRMPVFHAFHESCLDSSTRLSELTEFYEEALGHVPVAAINDAWFRYMMHPSYRGGSRVPKRCFDVVTAVVAGVALLPLIGVLALLIRRDGGPAIHRQTRIGARGRPFTLYKLRSMAPVEALQQWSSADDPRVTPIGSVLRRMHIDELPQLLNVLRGEMSIVGPRPEQPELVARLERDLPFYQRRHLIKPGITGWAQIRCGYAGSEAGSAWKLCHDLYYVKRRSAVLDFVILVETVRTFFADRQYPAERATLAYMLGLRAVSCAEPAPVPGKAEAA